MIVHYMKEKYLEILKSNIHGNLKNYQSDSNNWIYDFFDGKNPFGEYKISFVDFNLHFDSNSNDRSKQDVENCKTLYLAMKDLTDTQAADEMLWAGLTHYDFYSYMNSRVDFKRTKSKSNPTQAVLTNYFFRHNTPDGIHTSIFVNGLSKLWWIGRLTYDETRENPFELLDYFKNDFSTKSLVMMQNKMFSSKNVLIGTIEALMELQNENFTYGKKKRDIFYEIIKFFNIYGATHILDFFSKDEIKRLVINHMHEISYSTDKQLFLSEENHILDEQSIDNLPIEKLKQGQCNINTKYNMSNANKYKDYLINIGRQQKTVNYYITCLKKLKELFKTYTSIKLDYDIYYIDDLETIETLINLLHSNNNLRDIDLEKHHSYSAPLNHYYQFLLTKK